MAPASAFQNALKARDIKINGQRVSENVPLHGGDQVVWFTTWSEPELDIVYEDENIIVLNKPAGISTDAQADGAYSVERWANERSALVVHRLDQQTSGLLILAKNTVIEEALNDAFRDRQIDKQYECLVAGVPHKPHAVWHAFLYKDAKMALVRVSPTPGKFAKEIVTEYDVIEAKGNCARLLVTLHTGRTHQIRAHMAYMGYPLLGDDKYGSREANRKFKARRLMLCSTRLRFHTKGALVYLDGRSFEIRAPFELST